MSRDLVIVTPENIPISLELAGLGSRFAALSIDMFIQFIILMVAAKAFNTLETLGKLTGLGYAFTPIMTIFSFVLIFGYFLLFEAIWSGQTIGKKLIGLRVVQDGGYPITFFASATRNLIRVADMVPLNYGVGAMVVFLNPEYKRLGDLVAGTVVIKERPARFLNAIGVQTVAAAPGKNGMGVGEIRTEEEAATSLFGAPRRPKYTGPRLPDTARNPLDVLTSDELVLLRRFATRRWDMTPDDAERLAYRLVVPLVARLNITFIPNVPPRYADLVSVIIGTTDLVAAEREEEAGLRF